MVVLAAGFMVIILIAVVVTLVDAARSAHWRTVAVRRRLSWERRNVALRNGRVAQRPS